MDAYGPWLPHTWLQQLEPKYADWSWTAFNPRGQPNFFLSRVLNPFQNPWFLQRVRPLHRDELSFYDTDPLRRTLDKHVNWEMLKPGGAMRLSVGAASLSEGEVVFFDSYEGPIEAKHVMASGALPPAFPPVQVGEDWYVDGVVSSNTPIEALEDKLTTGATRDTLVFLVDLWDRKHGIRPRTLDDLIWRQKSIQYGSRRKAAERVVRNYEHHPDFNQASPIYLNVYQVMLESDDRERQFSFSDADFSWRTFEKLKCHGYRDMSYAIEHPLRVGTLGGACAALYRYGAEGKHLRTDLLLK
jgi:NTE family protein